MEEEEEDEEEEEKHEERTKMEREKGRRQERKGVDKGGKRTAKERYLLSWDVLMATSLGSPPKKVMSRAASELPATRLLSVPQMFTTTSLDGSFWCPSLGNLVTRMFTTLVAARVKGQIVRRL